MKSSKKVTSISNLVVDFDLNIRNRSNYDIPTMEMAIKDMGRIVKPILVKEHENEKGKYKVLSGNRRTLAGQNLLNQEGLTVELKDALSKVDIIVFTELSAAEELSIIVDHGSEKPISRSEIVEAVWRLDRSFMGEGQIINLLYFALAKYSGNEKKLSDVPKNDPERSQFLKKWLHGTVGNYMLAASKMGQYVKDQFLKTHLAEDKLLPEGTTIEMRCSRERITQLSSAISADKKKAKDEGKPESEGWSFDKGGVNFNALIEKFKNEDKTGTRERGPERPSVKELRERADQYKSRVIKSALLVAAGEIEQGKGLVEADDALYQMEMKLEVLQKYASEIKDEKVRELVGSLLHGVAGGVELAIRPFIS